MCQSLRRLLRQRLDQRRVGVAQRVTAMPAPRSRYRSPLSSTSQAPSPRDEGERRAVVGGQDGRDHRCPPKAASRKRETPHLRRLRWGERPFCRKPRPLVNCRPRKKPERRPCRCFRRRGRRSRPGYGDGDVDAVGPVGRVLVGRSAGAQKEVAVDDAPGTDGHVFIARDVADEVVGGVEVVGAVDDEPVAGVAVKVEDGAALDAHVAAVVALVDVGEDEVVGAGPAGHDVAVPAGDEGVVAAVAEHRVPPTMRSLPLPPWRTSIRRVHRPSCDTRGRRCSRCPLPTMVSAPPPPSTTLAPWPTEIRFAAAFPITGRCRPPS